MENLNMFADTLLNDLGNDEGFANKVNAFQDRIRQVNDYLLEVQEMRKNYDKLPENERVQLDLCQLYSVNTLYFIYLKLQGIDVTNHPIKAELTRVREAMKQHKLVQEKAHPRLNKEVAARFVRSGLWEPKNAGEPLNKKIKFED